MSAPLPVDVVVVTWNSREMVLGCLRSLNASLVQTITVVDNGSTDGTAAAVREHDPAPDLVRLEETLSLAAAYNRGADHGSAELVLFLNDDILASDAALVTLAEALLGQPDAAAAAGRLVDPATHETQRQYQPRPFPTWGTFARPFLGIDRQAPVLDEETTVAVDQPPGASLLVRRGVFQAIGGWDEQFEFWYEDVDLARRLGEHGPVLYVPTAPFEHVGGFSARRLDRSELVSRHYRGALLYASKHFGAPQRVAAGLLYSLVAAARIGLSRRDRKARAAYSSVLSSGLRLAAGRRLSRP